ncbi:hypothetical protein I3842_11G002900 [Carya illinoinensis]|uniref:Protein FAR1-RELATED SEQUENCE n=1 Tax=Carya illinoinensis TaxID=32201 RepID=A0A922DKG5_CARIL|nr:hypothetical protein I3842_11G002900 [Carya illinoinensis]
MSTSRDHVEILGSCNSSADEVEMIEEDGEVEQDKNMPKEGHTTSFSYVELYVGLQFDDIEDAHSCYKAFSRRTGFSIRTNHTRLSNIDRSLIGVEYVCSREGSRRYNFKLKERARPEVAETKCGCKAMMTIKKDEDKWVVSKFVLQHNHELLTPRSISLLRGHRRVTSAQKNLIDTLNESGIPTRKIMSVLSKESGGEYNVGCIAKDVQNYLGNRRRQLLGEGDAQKLYEYFLESERNNLGFVYSIQLNENGSMGNCFWADARSRAAYQYFGDVVTFDATYLTNRYKMPFVPFTGVNHHHQSVMFGCALLINEKSKAMLGRAPFTIITYDDKSMAKAIIDVLPNTTHKLCLWHLLQKFQHEFNHCIHETLTIEKFELEWTDIWLQNFYSRRSKWVPSYLRNTFCAGMSTTQRSESINKFFKDYVRSTLNTRYLSEKEKDVKTKTSKPIMRTSYSIEEEAAKIYTRKSFLIFQDDLFNSQRFKAYKTHEEDGRKIYWVGIAEKEKPAYEVTLGRENNTVSCTCCKFEFIGFLCQHSLHVLAKKSILDTVMQSYILERWTMNAKSRVVDGICVDEGPLEIVPSSLVMKHQMGSLSIKKYEHASRRIESIHQELQLMNDDDCNTEGNVVQSQIVSNFSLHDLPHIVSKGRPRSLRQKNPKENVPIKKRRCSVCKQEGHVRSKCPLHRYFF